MPVVVAENRLPIQPNHVYIIPPNTSMESIDGVLILSPRDEKPALHMPIDEFFVSLAERQKQGAVGVLLSGLASDGTLGLKAIKVAGGITMAQDDSARFRNMPNGAISEGVVDLVISPKVMADELNRLSQRADIFRQTAEADEENEAALATADSGEADDAPEADALRTVFQLLRRAVGVDFSQYKLTTIRRRIVRRMLLYRLDTVSDYARYLRDHPAEATVLYNDLLINVTTFFRDTEAMNFVGNVLLPQLLKDRSGREPLRIWIPACSTGQEAFSLAILLMEAIGNERLGFSVHIFATDLSEPAIAKARLGTYTKSEVADVSPSRLERFFTNVDDHYRINKNIRDLCVFAPHNLFKDPPFSRLDLISCRNLLIYLNTPLQQKAFATFHYALKPNGFLLLGKSETVGTSASLFSTVEKNVKLYARRNDRTTGMSTTRISTDRPTNEALVQLQQPEPTDHMDKRGPLPKQTGQPNDLDRLVDTILLTQFVPASVVVDGELEIMQFRGSVGLFLEPAPGKASLNLLKMARAPLAFELRNTVYKARKSGQRERKGGLKITVNGKTHQVVIETIPLMNEGETPLFLVLFTEETTTAATRTKSNAVDNARTRQLEAEMVSLRDDMHAIIEEHEASNEELQSANEEIVSSNEELQSINEELETSKEEIESTNEELLTINQELQLRNDQLTEAYLYAEAIFGTIREATLVLDNELHVKSANQAFYQIFRARQEDTEGKLIFSLGDGQWNSPQLRTLLEKVVAQDTELQSFEVTHDFPGIGEKVMRLNARKVMQQQRQEAVLLAIEDITEHRRAQRLLEERQAWFRDLMDNAPSLIWVLGPDATFNFLNRAWLEFTGCSTHEALGQPLSLLIHPDDSEAYMAAYATSFLRRQPFSAEYRLQRHDGEYRWMQTNARPMLGADGTFVGYVGTSFEVHLQKTLNQELDLRVQQRTRQWADANARLEETNRDLHQTADRLQSVFNGVPASIMLLEAFRNADGQTVDFSLSVFNQSATDFIGQPTEVIRSQTLLELQPDFKHNDLFDSCLHVLATGEPIYTERQLEHPTPGYYAFFITRQVDTNGVVVTILNITARKNAEAEVYLLADSLQAVLDSSPASVAMLKARRNDQNEVVDFYLSALNQKFIELTGLSSAELMGASYTQFADTLWFGDTFKNLLHVLETKEMFYEEREVIVDGGSQWLAMSLSKHDDGVLMTGLDITALKQADQQREGWLQELKRSGELVQTVEAMSGHIRQRGEFLRATSHDLRGSFGIIEGAASLLTLSDTDEERADMLAMLQRNLRQATQMLTQLLDFSRLEAGKEQLQTASFDVAATLRHLISGLQPMANGKDLTLRGIGSTTLLVEGDMVKFHRIAQNLLLNALKYTPAGSVTVTWELAPEGNRWGISVRDTGTGLPPALVAMLSSQTPSEGEPTNGAVSHASGESASSGEGIGLFIVKRLSDLLGATLTVESQPGQGTFIQVDFPVRYTESQPG